MGHWKIFGLVVVLACVGVFALAPAGESPAAFDSRSFEDARKAAESQKKWFIVKGTAVWCGPCKQMERTTWRDERVAKWIGANAIAVSVDVDELPKLAEELAIEAMPTIIAFKDGKEFDRIVGFRSGDQFIEWLEGLARGEKSVEKVRQRAKKPEGGTEDIDARLAWARELATQRKYEEAADEYVWLWQNMLKHQPAMAGVRLSFMVSNMKELASKSEPALTKFTALRDEAAKQIAGEKVDPLAVGDWIQLNVVIGDEAATLAWFDKLKDEARWKPLLDRMSYMLEPMLIQNQRWADLGRISNDPISELDQANMIRATMSQHQTELPDSVPEERRRELQDYPNQMLRDKAGVLYAALLAAGRDQEAIKCAARARELEPSDKMTASLIATALKAGQPRAQQLEWLGAVATPDEQLRELKTKLQQSLKK